MITLNTVQIKDPNECGINKERVRGTHIVFDNGALAYSKAYKHGITMAFRNMTNAEFDVIDTQYQTQFSTFDTIAFTMDSGYVGEDVIAEMFMKYDSKELLANGRMNLSVTFNER